jgi:hypothetical protein
MLMAMRTQKSYITHCRLPSFATLLPPPPPPPLLLLHLAPGCEWHLTEL